MRFTSTRERVRTLRPRWALICWKCFIPYFQHTDLNFRCFRCKPFANLSIKPVKVKVTFLNKTITAFWNVAYSHFKTQGLLYQKPYTSQLCNSFVLLNYFSALNCNPLQYKNIWLRYQCSSFIDEICVRIFDWDTDALLSTTEYVFLYLLSCTHWQVQF